MKSEFVLLQYCNTGAQKYNFTVIILKEAFLSVVCMLIYNLCIYNMADMDCVRLVSVGGHDVSRLNKYKNIIWEIWLH